MSLMVYKEGELLRISPRSKDEIEVSTNKGRTWISRYKGTSCGDFIDIIWAEDELLAQTTRGLYYSTNFGRAWLKRS